jgi:hypothetical protein
MKLKISAALLLTVFMLSNASATIFWTGTTGSWSDPGLWDKGFVPDDIEAVKIVKPATVIIDSDVGNYSMANISIAGGEDNADAAILNIVDGGYLGAAKELRVGDASATVNGDIGYLFQTGGELSSGSAGKIIVGYKSPGVGNYTISGGSLTGDGTLFVGGSGEAGAEGTLTVVGSDPVISMRKMYVGAKDSKGTYPGIGTIAFEVGSDGVSPIQMYDSIYLDPGNDAASIANLVVTLTAAPPAADIVLLEDTGGGSIYGKFDFVNGVDAIEGAAVVLNYGNTNYFYDLTYLYDAANDGNTNDIALLINNVVSIPEPATIVLIAFSSLLFGYKGRIKS